MGITLDISKIDFNGLKEEAKQRLFDVCLFRFNLLGQQCVKIARTLNTYQDRTANLRNSIGYVIVSYGEIIEQDLSGASANPTVPNVSSGQWKDQVQKLISKLSIDFADYQIALIVVAGMEYASYVEDIYNLAVLDPSKQFAEEDAQNIARDIVNSFKGV